MENAAILVVLGLLVAAAAAAARRQRRDHQALVDHLRAEADEARARAADEREAAVRAAVDQVVAVNEASMRQHGELAAVQLDARRQLIDEGLKEVRSDVGARLERLAAELAALKESRAEKDGSLAEQLAATVSHVTDIGEQARRLNETLTAPAARGQWGERTADDVLRASGLVEGPCYVRQRRTPVGTTPDFTFFLPEGRLLHMDAKFPASAYLRWVDAEDDLTREREAKAFVRDVKARIAELGDRAYVDPESGTVEFVLCFLPNEGIYRFVHEHAPDLVDFATSRQVVLCTPSTLFGVLAVIRQATESVRIAQTSDQILGLLGAFEAQYEKFLGQVEKVGRGLGTTQKAYEELMGTRRRQLDKPLDRIAALRTERGVEVGDPGEEPSPRPLRAVGDDLF